MTDHQTLLTQARDVLMQQRATPAIYVGADGVRVACRVILCASDTTRSSGHSQQPADISNKQMIEVPKDVAAHGLAVVELAGQFEIGGVAWAVEAVPAGAQVMHQVHLSRAARTTSAGRRR